ncbi:Arc family DNA-binding protein, partial [Methylobacterium aquaticum]|uniref:Arc family DNA-binding protein n=1 Tax=Methylobacterium aquaticum TaxID=270351 RepID=UPI000B32B46F
MALRIPSRGSDQFNLRFPDGMRDRLREAAEANGRSMNAEIIARLEKSLSSDDGIHRNIFGGGVPLELGEEFMDGFIALLDKARARHDEKYGVVPQDQRKRAAFPLRVEGSIDLLHEVDTAALDAWIATRPDPKPSREEAARSLIAEGLQAKGIAPTTPSA